MPSQGRIPGRSATDLRGPITLGLPSSLRPEVMAALKADARAVPLRDQSAHFFALGANALELLDAFELLSGIEAAKVLRESFARRAAEVQVHSRMAGEDSGSGAGPGLGTGEEFLRGLDEWERNLFRRAHEGSKSVREWMESLKRH